MTQEQKAQRYDEAIDIARKINSGEGVAAPSGWTTCEVIFPELKESEDERIRKALIRFHKSTIDIDGINGERIVAWLEKQGEHANFRNKIQIGDKVTRNEDGVLVNMSQLKRVAKKDEKYGEQKPLFKKGDTVFWDGEEFNILDVTKDSYNVGGYIIPICRQNELLLKQKPAENAEPKFKVGDYIVSKNNPDIMYKITGIGIDELCKPDYICEHVGREKEYIGRIYNMSQDKVDINFRLWTIQDAKDGDVLVCPKYANDIIPNIFIFKNIERKDNDVFCHCSFLEKFRTEGYVANADPINTDFYPATKEQRDQLEKAMTDAGYTFDFEKKELKKIEQKQKWSEDDEYVIERLFCLLNNEQENYPQLSCDFQEIQEFKDWLKSLKDRVQSKVEWSEKDENYINDLIKYFSQNEKLKNTKEDIVSWLKSLRPQNRWKPSDEQINILFKYAEQNNKDGSILTSLYQDLKRLKE